MREKTISTRNKAIAVRHILILSFGSLFTLYGIIAIILGIYATIGIGVIGTIMIIIGIASVFNYRHNRKKVLGALKTYERISLSQLSTELKFTKRKTKGLIIDLRADERLKASFEPKTGDLLILEVDGEPPIAIVPVSSSGLPEHEEKYKDYRIPKDKKYCSHCGSIVKSEDQFCNNCGSYIN